MNSQYLLDAIERTDPQTRYGKVSQIVGLVVEAIGPADVALGELCVLGDPQSDALRAEVVGFRGNRVLLMPLGEIEGIRPGTRVFPTRMPLYIPVGHGLRGRDAAVDGRNIALLLRLVLRSAFGFTGNLGRTDRCAGVG